MPPKVLIVDDEVILADAIAFYLERHRYDPAVVHSGEEGLQVAAARHPDVAIVDLRLPGMDGLEMLRQLRQMLPCIMVVVISAHATQDTAEEVRQHGAFACLRKPLDLADLHAVVEQALTAGRLTENNA